MAALAAHALAAPARSHGKPLRVAVIGGGIVGASIAMHLAEGGAEVVQFEKTAPAAGATRNSFAWINAFVDDRHYQAMRLASMESYRRLDKRLGLGVTWGGYLDWARDEAEASTVHANGAQMQGTPYPARSLTSAEFTALNPNIDPGGNARHGQLHATLPQNHCLLNRFSLGLEMRHVFVRALESHLKRILEEVGFVCEFLTIPTLIVNTQGRQRIALRRQRIALRLFSATLRH
jgi:glycine/D-amino acid oxidase-like deaminating enzyme